MNTKRDTPPLSSTYGYGTARLITHFTGRYLKYTIPGFTADPTEGTMTNVGPTFSYAVIW